MQAQSLNIFISYKRTDNQFVDRLEVDLRIRGYQTWLDRLDLTTRIGQQWKDELKKEIERAHVILLVVSPNAIESPYVRWEYEYALRLGKPLIPLLYLPCPNGIPEPLQNLQWLDIQSHRYTQTLRDLNIILMDISLTQAPLPQPLPAFGIDEPELSLVPLPDIENMRPSLSRSIGNPEKLFDEGVRAKASGNLDRASFLWQRLVELEPNFRNGYVQSQLNDLNQQLQQRHLQLLREIAESSRRQSIWGREIAAYEAILAIQKSDREVSSRLQVAKKNQEHDWLYSKAREAFNEQDVNTAKEYLKQLWTAAPEYGDPAGMAARVGMLAPVKEPNPNERAMQNAANKLREAMPTNMPDGIIPKVNGSWITKIPFMPDMSQYSQEQQKQLMNFAWAGAGVGGVLLIVIFPFGLVIGFYGGAWLGTNFIKK